MLSGCNAWCDEVGWSINTVLENLLNTFNSIDLISPLRNSAGEMQTTLTKLASLEDFDFSTAINQLNQPLTGIPDFAEYIRNLRGLGIVSPVFHLTIFLMVLIVFGGDRQSKVAN
ncbi:unnamed protein product [Dibothriocephalus latus]|uniref:Uncharacterized protein n=1 Tax=Dibothriocephalus latus TaxID=60516 RepID=A0A3P7NMG6_DIBLA|nr:unnamed protein product [Dibothriocephalus latus]